MRTEGMGTTRMAQEINNNNGSSINELPSEPHPMNIKKDPQTDAIKNEQPKSKEEATRTTS